MITRSYPIHDQDPPGSLTFTYEELGSKTKLIGIKDQDQKIVDLARIWINGFPAEDLKRFKSTCMPEDTKCRQLKIDDEYHLKFEDWQWLSENREKREVREITLNYKKAKQASGSLTVPSCLKVAGLKKCIEKELEPLEGDQYLFYYKDDPLSGDYSLDEYSMENEQSIEVFSGADLLERYSPLQMATPKGSYVSVEEFQAYVNEMLEKINIVCQIELLPRGTGTGFMIAPYLIMTNEHVGKYIKTNNQTVVASFFYHERTSQILRIELDKDPICSSKSLDYEIYKLKPSQSLDQKDYGMLQKLGSLAKIFFNKASDHHDTLKKHSNDGDRIRAINLQLARANIIQHPSEPKRIAFRNNRIHDREFKRLHYHAKTMQGSSGSPVINDEGLWIGLHYSECIRINHVLFKYRSELCESLGYVYSRKDGEKEIYKKEGKNELYIYYSGDNQEQYKFEGGKLIQTLRQLIIELKQGTSTSFITDFLITQNKKKFEEKFKDHINCNTAIDARHILEDLKENKRTKMLQLKKAEEESEEEWKEFFQNKQIRQMKEFFTHNPKISIGIAVVSVLVVGLLINHKRKS